MVNKRRMQSLYMVAGALFMTASSTLYCAQHNEQQSHTYPCQPSENRRAPYSSLAPYFQHTSPSPLTPQEQQYSNGVMAYLLARNNHILFMHNLSLMRQAYIRNAHIRMTQLMRQQQVQQRADSGLTSQSLPQENVEEPENEIRKRMRNEESNNTMHSASSLSSSEREFPTPPPRSPKRLRIMETTPETHLQSIQERFAQTRKLLLSRATPASSPTEHDNGNELYTLGLLPD